VGVRNASGDDLLRLSIGAVATNVQRRRACYYFLRVATEIEPGILRELHDGIFGRGITHGERCEEAIHDWLRRWQIETPWSYEWGFLTIISWELDPPSPDGTITFDWPSFGAMNKGRSLRRIRQRFWPNAPKGAFDDEWGREAEVLELPQVLFDPLTEERAHALDRILNELRRAVRNELDRIIQNALAENNSSPISKSTGLEHFRWLARYQVKGERISQIARETRERKSVRDAINKLAELIGLTLRDPDPPGRPRKILT
jgi:hypothetical protein